MAIDAVFVMIQGVVDDDVCPRILACSLIDVDGDEHWFIEKEAVLLTAGLSVPSAYPQPARLACVVQKRWTDENDRQLVIVSTTQPWGTDSITGVSNFKVSAAQIVQLA